VLHDIAGGGISQYPEKTQSIQKAAKPKNTRPHFGVYILHNELNISNLFRVQR